jgi:arginyl-tRNA synthetase
MDEKDIWKQKIHAALNKALADSKQDGAISIKDVIAELPPKPEMGDIGFPMFPFAKIFKKAPPVIAGMVHANLAGDNSDGSAEALGPYVNICLNRQKTAKYIINAILNDPDNFFSVNTMHNNRIMVEFSSPNTNKPLHLGHLRNNVLGESISRILAAAGAKIRKVCIINDRGIHICKSMLAYTEHGKDKTPESENVKSDHFIGNFYVLYNTVAKEDAGAEDRAKNLLQKWESGDNNVIALWKKMNEWAVDGIKKTYCRTGISFDQYYFESDTYLRGKEEVLKGLERGLWFKDADGSIQADLTGDGLDKKILLRKDGTSLYITQDFGTAILRYDDWPFDKLVYVVGSEQQYHFKVLFLLLSKMGFDWARNLYHLSYGMVNLPDGKMKSREGTVVDADDLIDELRDMAFTEIKNKEREDAVGDVYTTAEKIALGALHYYLLQISPERDMSFNPKESLSFNGNTGPYLQYMGARICSILRRGGDFLTNEETYTELLTSDEEWQLIKTIAQYPQTVAIAAKEMNPSFITAWLYELSKNFSGFYHAAPVLNAQDTRLIRARLALCRATAEALQRALDLVCIPFLESM